MIQACELRLGNWFYQKCNKKYRQAEWYDLRNLALRETSPNYEAEARDLQPIPLTPELLKTNCGFKIIPGWQDCWVFNKNIAIYFHDGKIYYNDISKHVELKSLHQLQNLYYVLTSTELEIKSLN